MMNQLLMPLIALTAAIPTQCTPVDPPERPAQEIYIGENYNFPFDAEPGDTIIEVMNPEGDMLLRCNNHGGELRENPHTGLFLCWGIDF
jgi:hypothetical protein